MRYADISPTMREFLGCWEGFRRVGFAADDLYCAFARAPELGGALGCYITLRAQGREFNVLLGPAGDADGATLRGEYARVSAAIAAHQVPVADLNRIWRQCRLRGHVPELLLALERKGFRLPDRRSN